MRHKHLRRTFIAVLGIAILVAIQLWPAPPVPLGRDTTFVIAPLAEDGLPNYAQAIVEQHGEGIAADDNGAKLLWQAIGPNGIRRNSRERLFQELGIAQPVAPYLIDAGDKEQLRDLEAWCAEQRAKAGLAHQDDEEESAACFALAGKLADAIQQRPWRPEQLLPLASLLKTNQDALNLLVEAAAKPRMATPAVDLLADPNKPAMALLGFQAQALRTAARGLCVRAMERIADHDYKSAWRDLLASWRLGAQAAAGPTLIDGHMGVAIRRGAACGTLALLQADDLDKDLTKQIMLDLEAQPTAIDVIDAIDFTERCQMLDYLLRVSTDRLGGLPGDEETFSNWRLNPTPMLRLCNAWFDRFVAAVALPDRAQRDQELSRLAAELEEVRQPSIVSMLRIVRNRQKQSEMVASLFLAIPIQSIDQALKVRDRDQTHMALIRVAAALALYRIQEGAYPGALNDLIDVNIVRALPDDPYTDQPFVYQRRGDGYLLYSLYENSVDDGGNDAEQPIVGGEWIDDIDFRQPDRNASDLVIRLPLPPLELPLQAAPKDAKP